MESSHRIVSCRWAGQTLNLSFPQWLAASDDPWCCLRANPPRPLETTEECKTCANWEHRTPDEKIRYEQPRY